MSRLRQTYQQLHNVQLDDDVIIENEGTDSKDERGIRYGDLIESDFKRPLRREK